VLLLEQGLIDVAFHCIGLTQTSDSKLLEVANEYLSSGDAAKSSIGFQLLEIMSCGWTSLAEQYLARNRRYTALSCFFHARNFAPVIAAASQMEDRDQPISFRLFAAFLFKQKQVQPAVELLTRHDNCLDILRAYLKAYRSNPMPIEFLERISSFLDDSSAEKVGALYLMSDSRKTLSGNIQSGRASFLQAHTSESEGKVRELVCGEDPVALAVYLSQFDPLRAEAAARVIAELSPREQLMRLVERAMLNVARAGLLIQRGEYLASARILQTVAFAFPTEKFPQAIAVLACNPRVHKAVLDDFVAKLGRALFCRDVDQLVDWDVLDGMDFSVGFCVDPAAEATREYENQLDNEKDDLERGFLYFDLAIKHPGYSVTAPGLLKAAISFLRALEKSTRVPERFALQRLITTCLSKARANSRKLPSLMRTFITTATIAVHIKSVALLDTGMRIGADQVVLQPMLLNACLRTSLAAMKIVPFPDFCVPNAWSSSIRQFCSKNILRAMVEYHESNRSPIVTHAEARECDLMAVWHGWWGDRGVGFQVAHDIALASRLAQKGLNFVKMEGILGSPLFGRDIHGW
jgi:hypothetical protein